MITLTLAGGPGGRLVEIDETSIYSVVSRDGFTSIVTARGQLRVTESPEEVVRRIDAAIPVDRYLDELRRRSA